MDKYPHQCPACSQPAWNSPVTGWRCSNNQCKNAEHPSPPEVMVCQVEALDGSVSGQKLNRQEMTPKRRKDITERVQAGCDFVNRVFSTAPLGADTRPVWELLADEKPNPQFIEDIRRCRICERYCVLLNLFENQHGKRFLSCSECCDGFDLSGFKFIGTHDMTKGIPGSQPLADTSNDHAQRKGLDFSDLTVTELRMEHIALTPSQVLEEYQRGGGELTEEEKEQLRRANHPLANLSKEQLYAELARKEENENCALIYAELSKRNCWPPLSESQARETAAIERTCAEPKPEDTNLLIARYLEPQPTWPRAPDAERSYVPWPADEHHYTGMSSLSYGRMWMTPETWDYASALPRDFLGDWAARHDALHSIYYGEWEAWGNPPPTVHRGSDCPCREQLQHLIAWIRAH